MAISAQDSRTSKARASFWRLIIYLCLAGVAMVIAALYYLSLSGPLTSTLVLSVTVGVFVSVVLGGGLMAVGFFSSNVGHDERAAGATRAPPFTDE